LDQTELPLDDVSIRLKVTTTMKQILFYAGASPVGLWQKVVDLQKANAS
jgi:hypothetical protein